VRARPNQPDVVRRRRGICYGLRPSQLPLRNASSCEGGQRAQKAIHLSTTGSASDRSPPRLKIQSARWLKIQSARTDLGVSFSRVYVRQLIIDLGFADCLKPKTSSYVGPSPQVSTATLMSWVAAALRHSPKAQGIEADSWSNERLRAAIERRFGIRYSRGHVWKIATDLELSHLIRKARR